VIDAANQPRHPGEGRDPVLGARSWIPVFAGMTLLLRLQPPFFPKHQCGAVVDMPPHVH
jgi:hypothetical protein